MKIVGGPRHGQDVTISENPGDPELQLEGMVLEYTYTEPGKINIRIYEDPVPKPSFPGLVERYKSQYGAWHFIATLESKGIQASPPAVSE